MELNHSDLQKKFEEYQQRLQEELILAKRQYEERKDKLQQYLQQINFTENERLKLAEEQNKKLIIQNNILAGHVEQLERKNSESVMEISKLKKEIERLKTKEDKDTFVIIEKTQDLYLHK